MKYNAIIIDDEQAGIDVLQKMINKKCSEINVLGTADDIPTGLDLINKHDTNIDLAFLDINLPSGNVFKLIDQIEQINFQVIFVTAHNEYTAKACWYSSMAYLYKPITEEDLVAAVDNFKKYYQMKEVNRQKLEVFRDHLNPNPNPFKKLWVSSMAEMKFVHIGDIIRLEADDNMTHFFMKSGEKITASKTFKYYVELLSPFNFFKVHQSHLINLNCIVSYVRHNGGYLEMEDGKHVEISRRRRPLFLERLRQLQDPFAAVS